MSHEDDYSQTQDYNGEGVITIDALDEPIPASVLAGRPANEDATDTDHKSTTSSALVPVPSLQPSNADITRSYLLNPSSVRNYDSLIEQLLEDHKRPQRTQVHMDVNLSVDLDLTPEVYGDLHLSMMCVTVKRKPWEEDVISRDGRRIAGTVLRISDGRGTLLHRQVVGFESLGEWWWVVRTQLQAILRRKAAEKYKNWREAVERVGYGRVAMILFGPLVMLLMGIWWLLSG